MFFIIYLYVIFVLYIFLTVRARTTSSLKKTTDGVDSKIGQRLIEKETMETGQVTTFLNQHCLNDTDITVVFFSDLIGILCLGENVRVSSVPEGHGLDI